MPLHVQGNGTGAGQAQRLIQAVLDLLFPPRCAACGCPGSVLCPTCRTSFVPLSSAVCSVCSAPLDGPGVCQRCAENRPLFARVVSGYVYEGTLREAIHAFKYRRRAALAPLLAEALAAVVEAPQPGAVLCAVPMHPDRLAQRGYNHAGLLADELGARWGLPLLPVDALRRVRPVAAQAGLGYTERLANVEDAFAARADDVRARIVWVVDDVCTTGATLNACSEALLAAGARAVYGVTLARTP